MIHPSAPTRITIYGSGGDPVARLTLETVSRNGRALSYLPESVATEGALPDLAIAHVFRGFRPALDLVWDVGRWSQVETYSAGAWQTGTWQITGAALLDILAACDDAPVFVEPFRGSAGFDFYGRCYSEGQSLRDIKNVVHSELVLHVEGVDLVDQIPTGSGGVDLFDRPLVTPTIDAGSQCPAWVYGPVGVSLFRRTVTIDTTAGHGSLAIGRTFLVLSADTESTGRLRLYTSEAYRLSDYTRPLGREIRAGQGEIAEVWFDDTLRSQPLAPLASASIFSGDSCVWQWDGAATTVTLTVLVLEA